ncbi:hypothetical protein HN385_03605 [archaeon]|jgi:thymidylate kinase|nr:hypothetical protein [archaeon]MBT3451217.1 hypothetical protein [archaeon]MBT6869783.1 hypothetical protein [archaeon]MBT7192738.1 hypothetical protein [archaeon]MBT7380763.1 hypothetical protein [archaeon]
MISENKFIDLVIGGPDMSGTSTQINDMVEYYEDRGLKVRDLRGTELDALFHTERLNEFNQEYKSLDEFLKRGSFDGFSLEQAIFKIYQLQQDLELASCVKNPITSYIDPDSADVWIMEEPTKRGAGQVNRVIEQNRSQFGSEMDPYSAALTHQVYRIDEFLRFRGPLREAGKIIIRSRSEESACYQILDVNKLEEGIKQKDYLNLPGHKIAFSNPPTHLFIACASKDWTKKQYLELKEERSSGRILDDHELNVDYQLLVNRRYASAWLDILYDEGSHLYGSEVPDIHRFNLYSSKDEMKQAMGKVLDKIMFDAKGSDFFKR